MLIAEEIKLENIVFNNDDDGVRICTCREQGGHRSQTRQLQTKKTASQKVSSESYLSDIHPIYPQDAPYHCSENNPYIQGILHLSDPR